MNQPHELAAKIHAELDTHSFKALISRYRNSRELQTSVEAENRRLLETAAALPALLAAETRNVEAQIGREEMVTEALNALLAERREADLNECQELERREIEVKDELARVREARLASLKSLDEKTRVLTSLDKTGGLTADQESARLALAVLARLPINSSDTESTLEDNWRKLGELVRFAEEPYVPLLQKFPAIQQFLSHSNKP